MFRAARAFYRLQSFCIFIFVAPGVQRHGEVGAYREERRIEGNDVELSAALNNKLSYRWCSERISTDPRANEANKLALPAVQSKVRRKYIRLCKGWRMCSVELESVVVCAKQPTSSVEAPRRELASQGKSARFREKYTVQHCVVGLGADEVSGKCCISRVGLLSR